MSVLMSLRPPFQRGEIWYYEIDRKRLSLQTRNKAEAMRLFGEIRKMYLAGKVTRISGESNRTLGDFIEEVLEWCRETKADETFRAWRAASKALLAVAGKSCRLDMLTLRHWDMALAQIKGKGRKTSTANSRLGCLRSMFSKAVEWQYLKRNPMHGAKMQPTEKRPPAFIAPEDVQKWLESIHDLALRRLCAALVYTGRRQSEMLTLHWEDVDFEANTYSAMLHKTKTRRTFPMHPVFRAVLESMRQPSGRVWQWICRTSTSVLIKKALVAGGHPHMHAHDLRHTFASLVILSGNELKVAQELLGHASMRSTMIYAHLTPSAIAAGLSKIAAPGINFCVQIEDTPRLRRVK
jgi:integrase